MKIKKLALSLVVCGGLFTTFISNADITITQKNGDKTFISKSMIKKESFVKENVNFIASMETGELFSIDHNNEQYIESTAEASCQVQNQLSALIPDFRRGKDKPKIIINAVEKNVDVAGYSTTKYKVFVGEELKEIVWMSSDDKLSKTLKNAELFFDKMLCMGNFHYSSSDTYKEFLKQGVELKSYGNLNGISEDEIEETLSNQSNNDIDETDETDGIEVYEVAKIDYSNLSASEFAIPSDYEKVTIAQAQGRQMQRAEGEMENESKDQQQALDALEKLTEKSGEIGSMFLNALDKAID